MKIKVLGFQKVHYTSKKTNKEVSGISLFISRNPNPNEVESVQGVITDKIWLPSTLIQNKGFIPAVDSEYELVYEFDGRNAFLCDYKEIK